MAPQVVDETAQRLPARRGPGADGAADPAPPPAPAPAPASASGPERIDAELLIAASVLLAEAALTAKRSGAELTGALFSWRFGLQALRRPGWAFGTALSCAQALTGSAGLGFGANGGLIGELVRMAGSMTYRRPAKVAMAVDAFALRIKAAAADHPNLDAPAARRLTDAMVAGNRLEALRAVHGLIELLGVTRALTTVSPVIMELLALLGMLDENPVNDDFSWVTLAGGVPTTDPVFGLPSSVLAFLNPGPGRAERADPDPILAKVLASSRNDIVSYVNDIGALGNHGLVLLRRVACADGAVRYVLLLPGTSFGLLSNSTPQDLVGAFDGLLRTDTTYTRAAKKLLRRAGVPAGSELMIIGHSLGGMTAMNLASDVEVSSTYRVTHVVAIGSPIDGKRPADHTTQVVSLVNEHDVIPGLDGRGPAAPHDIPASWVELAWLDESYDYPLSHAPQAYSDALRGELAHYRERVNELISAYDGEVIGNQPYMLRDK
ncbi:MULTISPECIES: lipase family protein [unclassified Streptomyces]|uniref:lipase family protein n=1 Tax=unclassified Streptomyces TaxID=2593676 RepID=UPI002E110F5F|nr:MULTISPECIES: lipase family protein [unclassified Streptomyces]WSR22921.1 lipase family protein [Streptomyces sp. NBC_01205]